MPRILVPVDGSANSDRAVSHAIALAKDNQSIDLHVINVQPPILSGLVHMFISPEEIALYHTEEGEKALASARRLLDQAKSRYRAEVKVGHCGETIAEFARREKCDQIVMGTRGMSTLGNWVLGSVATKVLHLADVPVTLVK